jgi:adenylate kinase
MSKKLFNMSKKLFNMIFIGPPGGGKGTEIQLLQQLDYFKVSTGDLLRDEVEKGTELGKSIKADMDSGKLIKDSIVTKLLDNKIKERNYGLIFDGYPRNVEQAKTLDSILEKNNIKLDVVFHLQTSDKVIIDRIVGRYICKKCGASYNKNGVQPKKSGVCDVCDSKEFKVRDDDKIEVVEKRLKEYHQVEKELLDYYNKKNLVHVISGEAGDQQLTHDEVLEVFNKLSKESVTTQIRHELKGSGKLIYLYNSNGKLLVTDSSKSSSRKKLLKSNYSGDLYRLSITFHSGKKDGQGGQIAVHCRTFNVDDGLIHKVHGNKNGIVWFDKKWLKTEKKWNEEWLKKIVKKLMGKHKFDSDTYVFPL